MAAAFPQLRELHTSAEYHNIDIPTGLCPLLDTFAPQLRSLHLHHLAGVPPTLRTALQQCTQLTHITLNCSDEDEEEPSAAELTEVLTGLGRLRSLDMYLDTSRLDAIANALMGLTRLRLDAVDRTLVMPSSLTTLTNLVDLSLPDSDLAVQGLQLLRQLTRLEAYALVESDGEPDSPGRPDQGSPAAGPGRPWSLPPRLEELQLTTYAPGRLMGPCQAPETLRGIELRNYDDVEIVLSPYDDVDEDGRLRPEVQCGLLNCIALLRGRLREASLAVGTLEEHEESPIPGLAGEAPDDEGDPDADTGPSHSIWLAALAPLQLRDLRLHGLVLTARDMCAVARQLPTLQGMDLCGCAFELESLVLFSGHQNLERLRLELEAWNEDTLRATLLALHLGAPKLQHISMGTWDSPKGADETCQAVVQWLQPLLVAAGRKPAIVDMEI